MALVQGRLPVQVYHQWMTELMLPRHVHHVLAADPVPQNWCLVGSSSISVSLCCLFNSISESLSAIFYSKKLYLHTIRFLWYKLVFCFDFIYIVF